VNIVVRLPNWLGDTVMAVPALRSLRAAAGDDRLAVAGPWAHLLAGQAIVDACFDYPRSWSGRIRAADPVAAFRPDVAVLLPNSLEAALSAWYWGAHRRIGFDEGGRGALLTDRVPLPRPRLHQIDEYLLLLEPLGIAAVTREPALSPPVATRGRLLALLGDEVSAARPIVGLHLGAAFGPAKVWPAERTAALGAALLEAETTPVLLGTPADSAVETRVQAHAPLPLPSLVGRDTPELLPAVLAGLDALVSGDTGTAHLAAAMGTAVVTLFGPTDPRLSAPRGRATWIAKPVPCAPCFYSRCPIDHPCMWAIPVDEVRDAVLAALARAPVRETPVVEAPAVQTGVGADQAVGSQPPGGAQPAVVAKVRASAPPPAVDRTPAPGTGWTR
jgi:heptosyltransferase II